MPTSNSIRVRLDQTGYLDREVREKWCQHCQRWLRLRRFSLDSSTLSGFAAWCKRCRKGVNRKYYQTHRRQIKKASRLYRQANLAILREKDRLRELEEDRKAQKKLANARYRVKNRELLRQKRRRIYQEDKALLEAR